MTRKSIFKDSAEERNLRVYEIVAVLAVIIVAKAALLWIVIPLAEAHGLVPGTASSATDLYLPIAQNVLNGIGFRVSPDTAETMMRGPTYIYVLAGLLSIFGSGFAIAQISNLFFGIISTFIIYYLTRKLTANGICATFAALIFTFHPGVLVMESRISVESFFICMLCIFVLLLYRAIADNSWKKYFIAGLALGLTVLTRSSPIVIIPCIFLYLAWTNSQIKHPFKYAVMQTGVLALGALLVLSPWMARNYVLAGTPTFSENILGIVAFQGQYITRTASEGRGYQQRIHESRRLQSNIAEAQGVRFRTSQQDDFWEEFPTIEDELEYNKVLLDEVLKNYWEDPWLLPRHVLRNIVSFWFQGATPKITRAGILINGPLVLLALVGCYIAFRRNIAIAPMMLVMFCIYSMHILLIAHARYSTSLVPFLAILSGIALSALFASQSRGAQISRIADHSEDDSFSK